MPSASVASFFLLFVCSGVVAACGTERSGDRPSSDTKARVAALVLELAIGEENGGSPEYDFASIVDMVVSREGTIWVLDGDGTSTGGQSPLVRRYGADGTFLGQVGREGSGPGEYRAPSGLALMPDGRVALRDFTLADRVTLFEADGALGTTWPLRGGLFWTFRSGYPIQADTGGVVWLRFRKDSRPGPDRSWAFLRLGPDGTVLDTVPSPPVPEVDRQTLRIVNGTAVRGFSLPYQPSPLWAWSPFGYFAIARGDLYRIELLPPPFPTPPQNARNGGASVRPLQVISRDILPVPVPEAERASAGRSLAERVSRVEGGRHLQIPEIPDRKPLIRFLDYADDGRLLVWVSMPSNLKDGEWVEASAFDVFDLEGRFEGRVVLPDSFSLVRMRGGLMWGVFRGDYGVESIRRYKITWP